MLAIGDYKSLCPLLICSSLPTICDGNADLLDALMEPKKIADIPPPLTCFSTSPVMSAMLKSCGPIVLVVVSRAPRNIIVLSCSSQEIGHAVLSVVPVYYGMSVAHAARRVSFGSGDLLSFLAVLADISLSKNRSFVKTAFAQVLETRHYVKKSRLNF
jgi:hypothetical protein